MTERYYSEAEQEARERAIDIYKTLGIRFGNAPFDVLWREILIKTRGRFDRFKFKPLGYNSDLFIPQAHRGDTDEQVSFSTRNEHSIFEPRIEWRALKRNTAETKELFTAILSLKKGKPRTSLMTEVFSLFRVKNLGIDNLLGGPFIPKMKTKTVTIEEEGEAYFGRDEEGKKVEGLYLPVKEALARISIPG